MTAIDHVPAGVGPSIGRFVRPRRWPKRPSQKRAAKRKTRAHACFHAGAWKSNREEIPQGGTAVSWLWSFRQKLERRSQDDRCLGQSNAEKHLFVRNGLHFLVQRPKEASTPGTCSGDEPSFSDWSTMVSLGTEVHDLSIWQSDLAHYLLCSMPRVNRRDQLHDNQHPPMPRFCLPYTISDNSANQLCTIVAR